MTPYFQAPDVTLYHGHVLDVLAGLPDESVHCVVTSPPFFGLRDYGLPPTIWDADDPDCQHEWGSLLSHTKGGSGQDRGVNNRTYQTNSRDSAQTLRQGQFCRLCGCWYGSLGLEPTPEMYVHHLVSIFRHVKRVLRADGVAYVNVGDSFAGSGKGPSGGTSLTGVSQEKRQGFANWRTEPTGLVKPKSLCLIPERLALALQGFAPVPSVALEQMADDLAEARATGDWLAVDAVESQLRIWSRLATLFDGWWVRQRIAWAKLSCMPESVTDRATSAWEHVWMLTKAERYYYDGEAVKEPHKTADDPRNRADYQVIRGAPIGRDKDGDPIRDRVRTSGPSSWPAGGRNQRNWWLLPPEPSDAQFCSGCKTFYDGPGLRRIVREKRDGVEVMRCPKCGTTDRWVAHYAAFVSAIPRRAILAATSERGACAKCKKPWERVVEKRPSTMNIRVRDAKKHRLEAKSGHGGRATATRDEIEQYGPEMMGESTTLGWRPGCACEEPTVSCTVLDPFVGSGTTTLVARQLGRRSIGIDLCRDYLDLTIARLEAQTPALPLEVG